MLVELGKTQIWLSWLPRTDELTVLEFENVWLGLNLTGFPDSRGHGYLPEM
jgi:hypothetical protein